MDSRAPPHRVAATVALELSTRRVEEPVETNDCIENEGIVTVSTDQNSGSPFSTGSAFTAGEASSADGSYFATPSFDGCVELDLSAIQASDLDTFEEISSGSDLDRPAKSADRDTDDSDRTSFGKPPTDAIEFRVVRSGLPVRRLRLTGNRYTFGSAEGCSIRLNDATLRPMHAVLIRDPARVIVRAYSVPVNINGKQKTEATLQVGDVMRLGVYQFELMSVAIEATVTHKTGSHPLHDDAPEIPLSTAPRSVFDSEPTPKTHSSNPSSNREASLPSAEDVIWRERLRREIDQWRERQIECDHREQRIDQREASLRGRETELWTRAETLLRRESRLQSQESTILQLQEDYSQRQQDLIELREHTQAQKDALRAREAEFRRQEHEYQFKLEEASRQLIQSRQQAESATQSVQRMREQFESLNRQIDELSSHQKSLQAHETQRHDEAEAVRERLERERDEAVDAQTQSEALRRDAEARIEAMESELESLKNAQDHVLSDKQAELAANEDLVAELQAKVTELQRTVSQASEESARLRRDYAEACESVRQLESLVAQSNQRGDLDRESWAAEADQLRTAIDELSIDLARANGEVSELSSANDALSVRLQQVQSERDEAQSRPTHEAFASLQRELETANEKLAEMKREYEQTIGQRDESKPDLLPSPSFNVPAPPQLNSDTPDQDVIRLGLLGGESDDLPASSVLVNASVGASNAGDDDAAESFDADSRLVSSDEVGLVEDSAVAESTLDESSADEMSTDPAPWNEVTDELDSNELDSDDADDDVWPTYQTVAPERTTESTEPIADVSSDDEPASWASVSELAVDDDPFDGEPTPWGSTEPKAAFSAPEVGPFEPEAMEFEAPDQASPDQASPHHDSLEIQSAVEDDVDAVSQDPWSKAASDFADDDADDADADPWQAATPWKPSEDTEPDADSDAELKADALDDVEPAPMIDWNTSSESEEAVEVDAPQAVNTAGASPFHGSLASMLIKDLEAQSDSDLIAADQDDSVQDDGDQPQSGFFAKQADHADTYDGTLVLDDDATGGSPWSPTGGLAKWDREHPEDSIAEDQDVSPMDAESAFPELYSGEASNVDDATTDETESREDEVDDSSMVTPSDESPMSSDPSVTVDATEEDDDSIEAYMNRLLNRVQGSSGSNTAAVKPETLSMSTSTPVRDLSPISESLSISAEPTPSVEPVDPNAPLVPRSQAPERKSDLSAMRDLANSSARTAISHSTKNQIRNIQLSGMFSLALAFGAIIVALGSTFLFGLSGGLLYLAWAMTLIIAGVSVRDAMNSFAEANRRMKVRSEAEADEDSEA